MNDSIIIVSACIIAFNQEQFISAALDSAIDQQVNFPYEIIVADDCSSDRTREILLEYQARYPNLIRLIFNDVNLGATKNTANLISNARGKYIATLDGDDFWTSPLKLQKQVDFLDANIDCAMCFHGCDILRDGELKRHHLPVPQFRRERSTMMDYIIFDSFMPSCAVMFRNKLFPELPPAYFSTRGINDWPLYVLITQYGDIGYIDESMCTYRQASSENSFSSKSMEKIFKNAIVLNKAFNRFFQKKYQDIFIKKISKYYLEMSKDQLRSGNLEKSRRYLSYANHYQLHLKRTLKLQFYYFPRLWLKNVFKSVFS